jgi:rubredoxin
MKELLLRYDEDAGAWIDNGDSWICPMCRFETSSPAKYPGCKCPKCGFQAEKDKMTENIERNQEHKADGGKLMMELIPTTALVSLGNVLTYGAKKYSPNSWQRVERERYVGALLRHFVAYMNNPTGRDEESGLMHIEHVLCNAAFLNDMAQKSTKPAEWYEGKYQEWVNDNTSYSEAEQAKK